MRVSAAPATYSTVPGLRQGLSDNKPIVAAGCADIGGGRIADNSSTGRTSLVRFYFPQGCTNLVFRYESYYKNTYYENPLGTDLAVKAALWLDSGGSTRLPISFSGQRPIVLPGTGVVGTSADSDSLGVYVPAGYAWLATYARATTSTQTVTISATGGTFTLTASGQTTAAIAWNAAAAAVQTALAALWPVGTGNVTVSGSAGGPYTVVFGGVLTPNPPALMTGSGASLTGGSGTVTIAGVGWIPIGQYIYGTSGGTGEGTSVGGDTTDSGSVTTSDSVVYTATLIRGQVGTAPIKTFAFWGDSVARATGDVNIDMGFLARAMGYAGPSSTPLYPFSRLAAGGEKTTDQQGVRRFLRMRRSLHASYAWLNTGINDVAAGTSLATIEANLLEIAAAISQSGARVVPTTLPPNTTSSDKHATATNQSVGANEANRTGLNDWLRDGAPVNSSGVAVAVGTTAAGTLRAGAVGHPFFDYVEVADAVEANSSNVLARNGGRWQVADAFAVGDSGTATSGSSTTLVDSSKSWTVNAWQGKRVYLNAGTGAAQSRSILSNTATALTVETSWTSPDATTTYQIDNAPTLEGTHPLSITHARMAAPVAAKAAALPA